MPTASKRSRSTEANVIDSSAWLAYLADEPGAVHFADPIEDTRNLVVPVICVLEVFKVVLRERGEGDALQVAALMQQGRVTGPTSSPRGREGGNRPQAPNRR